jgi:pSer/pThr/pTyr-binding forkhead associated (FHA) protein
MSETRKIIGHPSQDGQGPHLALPMGFTPLRLTLETLDTDIEVVTTVAIVGRHTDVDLRFAFADVSRRHCQFVFDGGVWRVVDLKSLNGVYVNNQRITDMPLYAGDHVRVGCVTILVVSASPVRQECKLQQIAAVLPAA